MPSTNAVVLKENVEPSPRLDSSRNLARTTDNGISNPCAPMSVTIFCISFLSDASFLLEPSVSAVTMSPSSEANRHDEIIPFFSLQLANSWVLPLLNHTVFNEGYFDSDFGCKFTDDFETLWEAERAPLLMIARANGDGGATEEKWRGNENSGTL